jgi:hypothetical protein
MRLAGVALALCLAAGAPAFAQGFSSDVDTIQIVSANVGGKNVFIPSTIVVTGGKPVTLSIFNTTDIPHGFAIPGIKVETVLPVNEEHAVKLPALEGGHVYQVNCQLHPAHRTATLVVLPGKK